MTLQTDLAYLAGLVDGEGTVSCSITKTKKGCYALHKQFSIFNTNPNLISWITVRFGGLVHSRVRSEKWKTEYQVKWSAEDATKLLTQILPYLVIKKEQAEIFIELHRNKSHRVSEELQKQREFLVARVAELNKQWQS